MASKLKEQVEAVVQDMKSWPAWRRREIEAVVVKTPLRAAALVLAFTVSTPAFAYNDFDALSDAAWGIYGEVSNSPGHAQYIGFADEDAANAAAWGSRAWETIQETGYCYGQSGSAYSWLNDGWGHLNDAANAGPADWDDPDAFWGWYSDANWILSEVQWYLDTYIAGC